VRRVTVEFDSDLKKMEIGSTKLIGQGVKKKRHKKRKRNIRK
jgi:hypothetical protein